MTAMPRDGRNRSGLAAGKALATVPHYRQTLDFTCGPSSLVMAMHAFDPASPLDRTLELKLWKEATSIYTGPSPRPGGCGALGLALAARRRGFPAEVHVNHRDVLLARRARSGERREVMRLLHEADLREACSIGIPIHYQALDLDAIEAKFGAGLLPIVLVSTHYIHGDHVPHWIVVTGFDAAHVYVNDPWVSVTKGKTAADMTNLPIPRPDFDRMATYGRAREKAVVLIGAPEGRR